MPGSTYVGAKDAISRTSVDAFTALHALPSPVTATAQKTTTTVVISDLAPFCSFEAYDSIHHGTVWGHKKSNYMYTAVVGPVHLELVESHQTKKCPAKTKIRLTCNVLRWDGSE
jgi:hypothetical protein